MARAPSFLICGGQRCGSTTLAMGLDTHRMIHVAKPLRPEPKFFASEEKPEADFNWYKEKWFGDCDNGDLVIGEKSTSYLDAAGSAERIRHYLPSAKLIFILRHPVERAISNYLFTQSNGLEPLSFDEAIRTESVRLENPVLGTSVHPHGYIQRSIYFNSLRPYFENFEKEQMHFVLFGRLIKNFEETIKQVFEFLEVEPLGHVLPVKNSNPQDWTSLSIQDETLDYLFSLFQNYNQELADLIGEDLQHWNAKTELIINAMSSAVGRDH